MQLFGFLCITAGAFIYNGMFKIDERRKRRRKKIQLDLIEGIDQEEIVEASKRETTNE